MLNLQDNIPRYFEHRPLVQKHSNYCRGQHGDPTYLRSGHPGLLNHKFLRCLYFPVQPELIPISLKYMADQNIIYTKAAASFISGPKAGCCVLEEGSGLVETPEGPSAILNLVVTAWGGFRNILCLWYVEWEISVRWPLQCLSQLQKYCFGISKTYGEATVSLASQHKHEFVFYGNSMCSFDLSWWI